MVMAKGKIFEHEGHEGERGFVGILLVYYHEAFLKIALKIIGQPWVFGAERVQTHGAALVSKVVGLLLNRDDGPDAGLHSHGFSFLQKAHREGDPDFGEAAWSLIFARNKVFDVPPVDLAFDAGWILRRFGGAIGVALDEEAVVLKEVDTS